jgi:NAD(P)-dependent dehydrogenase (short-subunit alcohol dehydrogenase family)
MSTLGPLSGQVAVVTGASRGIGAATAATLAGAGATVVLAARSPSALEPVVAAIRARGGRAEGVACDVTDEAAVAALAAHARARCGEPDIVVLAAGEGGAAALERLTLAEWNAMLAVHATGSFLCARAFVPAMRVRGHGRLVAIASTAALSGGRYISHYCAAKHAQLGLVRALAAELEGSGVTANALCPGFVDTPMTARTIAQVVARTGRDEAAALAAVLASAGQERLLRPEEVAAAALALCLPEAASTQGRAITLMPQGDTCLSTS